ncbi:hypothetical protein KFE69_06465 [bacterium SCSIO 12844]|nr:hypothetical protein KFE69_06465 [bacterium SCSIO 12844]
MPDFESSEFQDVIIEEKNGGQIYGEFMEGIAIGLKSKGELSKKLYEIIKQDMTTPPLESHGGFSFLTGNSHAQILSTDQYYSEFNRLLDEINTIRKRAVIDEKHSIYFRNTLQFFSELSIYTYERTTVRLKEDDTAISNYIFSLLKLFKIIMSDVCDKNSTTNLEEIKIICDILNTNINHLKSKFDTNSEEGRRIGILEGFQKKFINDIQVYAAFKKENAGFSNYISTTHEKIRKVNNEAKDMVSEIAYTTEDEATNTNQQENVNISNIHRNMTAQLDLEVLNDTNVAKSIYDKSFKQSVAVDIYQNTSFNRKDFQDQFQNTVNTYYEPQMIFSMDEDEVILSNESKKKNVTKTKEEYEAEITNSNPVFPKKPIKMKAELSIRKGSGFNRDHVEKFEIKDLINNELTRRLYQHKVRSTLRKQGIRDEESLTFLESECLKAFNERHPESKGTYYKNIFDTRYKNNPNNQSINENINEKENKLFELLNILSALEECFQSIEFLTDKLGVIWWAKNQRENLRELNTAIASAEKQANKILSEGIFDDKLLQKGLAGKISDQFNKIKSSFPSGDLTDFNSKVTQLTSSEVNLEESILHFYDSSNYLAQTVGVQLKLKQEINIPYGYQGDVSRVKEELDLFHQDNLVSQQLFQQEQENLLKARKIVSDLRKEKENLREQNSKTQATLDELEQTNNKLNQNLDSANDNLLKLQTQLQERTNIDKKHLNELLEPLQKHLDSALKDKDKIEKTQKDLAEFAENLKHKTATNSDDTKLLDNFVQTITNATELLSNYKKTIGFLEDLSTKLKSQYNDIIESDIGIKQTFNNISNAIQASKVCSENFSNKIKELQDALLFYKKVAAELQKKLNELTSQFDKIKKENEQLKAQLKASEKNIEEAKSTKNIENSSEIEGLKSQIKNNESSLSSMENKISEYENKVKELEALNNEKDQQLRELKQKSQDFNKITQNFEQKSPEYDQRKQQLENEISQLSGDIKQSKNLINTQQQGLSQANAELTKQNRQQSVKTIFCEGSYQKDTSTSRTRLNKVRRSINQTKTAASGGNGRGNQNNHQASNVDKQSTFGSDLVFIMRDGQRRWTNWSETSLANIMINKYFGRDLGDQNTVVYDKDDRVSICQNIVLRKLGLRKEVVKQTEAGCFSSSEKYSKYKDKHQNNKYSQLITKIENWVQNAHDMVTNYFGSNNDYEKAASFLDGLVNTRLKIYHDGGSFETQGTSNDSRKYDYLTIAEAVGKGINQDKIIDALERELESKNDLKNQQQTIHDRRSDTRNTNLGNISDGYDNLLFAKFHDNHQNNSGYNFEKIK